MPNSLLSPDPAVAPYTYRMTDIRVRIAPSPTGPLHLGTARTALFNFLFARHTGGTFIFRLEDTDQARSTVEFERDILDGMHWLGMTWDEGPGIGDEPERGAYGPYRQMLRMARYTEAADRLLAEDKAYHCYCSPPELDAERKRQEAAHLPARYNGCCAHLSPAERVAFEAEGRKPVVRFRIPLGRTIAFDDIVRGHVEIDTDALGGDLVMRGALKIYTTMDLRLQEGLTLSVKVCQNVFHPANRAPLRLSRKLCRVSRALQK